LQDKYLFSPWEAQCSFLQEAGIKLGSIYPYPTVELKESREAALMAFESLE
jgi:deoxyribodipyrimidine photolyase